jgi:hypothetical protein
MNGKCSKIPKISFCGNHLKMALYLGNNLLMGTLPQLYRNAYNHGECSMWKQKNGVLM